MSIRPYDSLNLEASPHSTPHESIFEEIKRNSFNFITRSVSNLSMTTFTHMILETKPLCKGRTQRLNQDGRDDVRTGVTGAIALINFDNFYKIEKKSEILKIKQDFIDLMANVQSSITYNNESEGHL